MTEDVDKDLSRNSATSGGTLVAEAAAPDGELAKVHPASGESQDDFISRCMSALSDEFPDQEQRVAACHSMWDDGVSKRHNGREYSAMMFKVTDAKALAALEQLRSRIRPEDLAGPGLETSPHITVKYGLVGDEASQAAEVVRGFGAVEVHLQNTSYFELPEFDVVKVDVWGDRLWALNQLIDSHLPHVDTRPYFHPHLTVAYVKSGTGLKYDGLNDAADIDMAFDTVMFSPTIPDSESELLMKHLSRMIVRHTIAKHVDYPGDADDKGFTYIFAAALVPDEVDLQGDVVSADEVQKAAFKFWRDYRNAGLMHQFEVDPGVMTFVENYVSKTEMELDGVTYPVGTWFLGAEIYDPKLRKAVLDGRLRGFSIGGEGKRTPIRT